MVTPAMSASRSRASAAVLRHDRGRIPLPIRQHVSDLAQCHAGLRATARFLKIERLCLIVIEGNFSCRAQRGQNQKTADKAESSHHDARERQIMFLHSSPSK